jgi:pentatricopeptide repeat protein
LMLQQLDKAAELEPNAETYNLLARAYESRGMIEEARHAQKKMERLVLPVGRARRILRPKRVVI